MRISDWSSDVCSSDLAVAFAKNSGVLRVKNALENFRKSGGIVNVYVGVDLGGTSYEALTALLLYTDTLNVVHSEKRSEERRVGEECVRKCRYRWSPKH